jgi:hypothetical protein
MNKFIFSCLAVVAAVVLLSACSEKFDVAAPYKSITVVYGILDRRDTAHYVRIQKAFMDQDKSALVMATVPDSSFDNDLEVRVAKINMRNDFVESYITLNRIDLNAEGYQKPSGTFFNTPNYAYKFKGDLDPNFYYRLLIKHRSTGNVDSAETPIIDDLDADKFNIPLIDDGGPFEAMLSFANQNPNDYKTVVCRYTPAPSYRFQGSVTPAAVAQGVLRFNWVDSNGIDGTETKHHYDLNLGYVPVSTDYFLYQLYNTALYSGMKSALGTAPPNVYRLIDRAEIKIYLGTPDFYTYITIQNLQSTGLTGSEIKPSYTNLKGKNVLGLFTARGLRSGPVTIDLGTVVFLKDNLPDARVRGTAY